MYMYVTRESIEFFFANLESTALAKQDLANRFYMSVCSAMLVKHVCCCWIRKETLDWDFGTKCRNNISPQFICDRQPKQPGEGDKQKKKTFLRVNPLQIQQQYQWQKSGKDPKIIIKKRYPNQKNYCLLLKLFNKILNMHN